MQVIVSVGFHRFQKNKVNAAFDKKWASLCPSRVIRWLADWKAKVVRGRGGREDGSVIHNLQQTSVYGIAIQFLHPIYGTNANYTVLVFTDVQNTSVAASIMMEEFAIQRLKEVDPIFASVWALKELLDSQYDVGRHFYANGFLCFKLITQAEAEMCRALLSMFLGGHGKSVQLDATAFGWPGVAGGMSELLKSQTQLRKTAQLVEFLRARKARHMSQKSQEHQELKPWFHFHLDSPPAHPANLRHLKQQALSGSFCWSSDQIQHTHSLMRTTEIRNHYLLDEGKGIKMYATSMGKALKANEYSLAMVPCKDKNGYKASWKMSAEDITDASEPNCEAIEKRRRLSLGVVELPAATKITRTTSTTCNVKPRWSAEYLADGSQFNLMGTEDLSVECKAHKLGSYGTKKEKIRRISAHMQEKAHPSVTARAKSKTLAEFFTPSC
jgi:hypothetical protein